jgi:hypothetical protein
MPQEAVLVVSVAIGAMTLFLGVLGVTAFLTRD